MKIKCIEVFRVELPLHEGSYNWSGGKSVEVFDSTVVRLTADDGTTGHGEVCPLGPAYLASYAEGARAGIRELAPDLLGGLADVEHAGARGRGDRLGQLLDLLHAGGQAREVGIELPGVTSCTTDGQCPPGQTCGADLQCHPGG